MDIDIKKFAIDMATAQSDYYKQLSTVDHKDLQIWFADRDQEVWEQRNQDQLAEAFSQEVKVSHD
jgi:hypothetical protein